MLENGHRAFDIYGSDDNLTRLLREIITRRGGSVASEAKSRVLALERITRENYLKMGIFVAVVDDQFWEGSNPQIARELVHAITALNLGIHIVGATAGGKLVNVEHTIDKTSINLDRFEHFLASIGA